MSSVEILREKLTSVYVKFDMFFDAAKKYVGRLKSQKVDSLYTHIFPKIEMLCNIAPNKIHELTFGMDKIKIIKDTTLFFESLFQQVDDLNKALLSINHEESMSSLGFSTQSVFQTIATKTLFAEEHALISKLESGDFVGELMFNFGTDNGKHIAENAEAILGVAIEFIDLYESESRRSMSEARGSDRHVSAIPAGTSAHSGVSDRHVSVSSADIEARGVKNVTHLGFTVVTFRHLLEHASRHGNRDMIRLINDNVLKLKKACLGGISKRGESAHQKNIIQKLIQRGHLIPDRESRPLAECLRDIGITMSDPTVESARRALPGDTGLVVLTLPETNFEYILNTLTDRDYLKDSGLVFSSGAGISPYYIKRTETIRPLTTPVSAVQALPAPASLDTGETRKFSYLLRSSNGLFQFMKPWVGKEKRMPSSMMTLASLPRVEVETYTNIVNAAIEEKCGHKYEENIKDRKEEGRKWENLRRRIKIFMLEQFKKLPVDHIKEMMLNSSIYISTIKEIVRLIPEELGNFFGYKHMRHEIILTYICELNDLERQMKGMVETIYNRDFDILVNSGKTSVSSYSKIFGLILDEMLIQLVGSNSNIYHAMINKSSIMRHFY